MKLLLITTRSPLCVKEQDGGAIFTSQLINHISLKLSLDVLFLRKSDERLGRLAKIQNTYFLSPNLKTLNRFIRRLDTSLLVTDWLIENHNNYDAILVQHVSSGFGFASLPESAANKMIVFPMFTGKSYQRSGENVPDEYIATEGRVLQAAKLIICPSKAEANDIIYDYGVDAQKIKFLPFGINFEKFALQSRTFTSRKIDLLYVATIKKQKNQLGCLEVIRSLSKCGIAAHIHFVGGVGDQFYHSQLLKKIFTEGLQNNITFHGVLFSDQIIEIALKCQFSISTAYWETFGIAIFESLAMGLPAIVFNDVPCFWEYVHINSACIGVPRNADAMAEKIQQFVFNSQNYKQICLQGRNDVSYLDEKIIAQKLIAQIRAFINENKHAKENSR